MSVSGVEAAFWNVCGVPVQATGTVVVVEDDVEVLVVEDEVELDVDELVELDVDDDVEVLVVVVDDVLVVVELEVEVDVDVEVLVVLDLVVDVELDVELEVVELDVLVLELVDVVVVVAKSQPMSVIRSRASDGSVMSVVYDGSMSSFGVSAVSQCETDEPLTRVVGAYICTWPLACRPAVRNVAAATTALPVQWRSALSIDDATRCASVMFGHVSPRLWSSRNFMKMSSRSL